MFLLEPAHPGCPGQNPESRKMVCVFFCSGGHPQKISSRVFYEPNAFLVKSVKALKESQSTDPNPLASKFFDKLLDS